MKAATTSRRHAARAWLLATALAVALAPGGEAGAAPAASPRPSAGASAAVVADGAGPAGEEVVVVEDGARWESAYGERFFQVVGTVTNRSGRPVGAARVRTELLDGEGKVVASFDGWNGRAEALGDLAGDAARRELAALAPEPIAAGGSDRFRATFLADETPEFEGHRVRVVDVLSLP